MTRALSFLTSYIRQWWHCYQTKHEPRRGYVGNRILSLGCWQCGRLFWFRSAR